MKNLIAFGLALAFAGAAVAGVLPSSNSGRISVYVPGAVGTAAAQPAFQSSVAFRTTGTGKLKNPRIWLACYQNGALVHGEGGGPSTVFKLGGGMSTWVLNGGGGPLAPPTCTTSSTPTAPASGTAKARRGNVNLAHTAFDATG
jgi:hypothetical protein